MNSMNAVILLGHVTRDPRLRTKSSGKSVCDFGLALNRRWIDINGDSKQETTFVDVMAWSQQAEVITEYCRKGVCSHAVPGLTRSRLASHGMRRERARVARR